LPPAGQPPPRALRIWSETLDPEALRAPRVTALLRRFRLDPLIAVRPWMLPEIGELGRALSGEGVQFGLWPMLADADGRWANVYNTRAYAELAHRAVDAVESAGTRVAEVAVDLEPPIAEVRRWLALRPWSRSVAPPSRPTFALARDELAGLVSTLGRRDVPVSCAVVPLVLLERGPGRGGAHVQRALGTPVDGPAWSRASVMLYTSLVEGWSPSLGGRKLVGRARALRVLARTCIAARARFGGAAGISLGAVGLGALGNEPVYRSPAELAEDVAVARAAGIDDLTLLDLGGVLARPDPEAWLAAFTQRGED
jgi:hypothetical protein